MSSSLEVAGYITWLRYKNTKNAIVPCVRNMSFMLPSNASANVSDYKIISDSCKITLILNAFLNPLIIN